MIVNAARRKYAALAVALFFVVLTAVGLLTLEDYTGSYDEQVQLACLKVNAREYALRLQSLGVTWAYGLDLRVPPIASYVERDHGIAAMYPCLPFLPLMDGSERLCYLLWDAVIWLWFMLGVWSVYAMARRLGLSRLTACAAALLMYLSPRFFADGHLNDKDSVLLSLVLICLWQGARLLDHTTLARGLLFSLFGALAVNLRSVGLLPWGLISLCAILKMTLTRQWRWKTVGIALGTLLSFVGFSFLLTPSAWYGLSAHLSYLLSNTAAFSRWSGTIYFRNAAFQIPEHSLPVYYLPYLMIVTLPLYTLPLCAVGQVVALREALSDGRGFFSGAKGLLLTCATLCWLMPMLAFVLLRPVVYNGWRHFYFCYAGLLLMGAYGIGTLWRLCMGAKRMRRSLAVCLALCFSVTAVGMALNHPYQAAYYNPLANKGDMETDYWNTGCTAALKRLADSTMRDESLPLEVSCPFFDLQNARFKMSDPWKSRITTTTRPDAPYLYYIENYVLVYAVAEPDGYHKLFETRSYGRLIGTMYERDTALSSSSVSATP